MAVPTHVIIRTKCVCVKNLFFPSTILFLEHIVGIIGR